MVYCDVSCCCVVGWNREAGCNDVADGCEDDCSWNLEMSCVSYGY